MCENTRTGDKVIIKRKTDLTNSVDETQNKTKEKMLIWPTSLS